MRYVFYVVYLWMCFFSNMTHAETPGFIQWHSTNIQLLRGFNYELGAEERTIATFEHANAWKYGDFFMFVDNTWPSGGDSSYYSELSSRFSLQKITGKDFSSALIKDVLLAVAAEKPQGQNSRKLYGVGLDLNIPGFTFFNTHFYVRDNPDLIDKTWQVTLTWKRPFNIVNTVWLAEGFADFSGAEGTTSANQLIVPRLLMDVGALMNFKKSTLWAGLEYSYWRNKFGVDGITESVPQLQVKWVF